MFEKSLLKGKRILITGGGTGLGYSMGYRFLELDAELAICGRRAAVLDAAAARLANLARFLLSDGAGHINGEVVAIDGGEWLQGSGQFNFLRRLSDADCAGLKPKRKG